MAAARQSSGDLSRTGWQVTYAMHSYTEGSQYKGIHVFLKTSSADRVEVQFQSVQSVKVKELTTPVLRDRTQRSVHGPRAGGGMT